MPAQETFSLVCPIRGALPITGRGADNLKPIEEFYRVEAIKHLIRKGYPKENFKVETVIKRFGNNGRNSFRCDFVVLDVPVNSISNDVNSLLEHAILLCEVKRTNHGADSVVNTQVQPMLDFAKRLDAIGLYWADVEQRVFWRERSGKNLSTKEGSLSLLPSYGEKILAKKLTFNDLEPSKSLIEVFNRIDDLLHSASVSQEKRYEVIFQLLLAKIFDEHAFETRGNEYLDFQDFKSIGVADQAAKQQINDLASRAINYYQNHLPKPIPRTIDVDESTLSKIATVLAPVKIIASERSVVQAFYMKFAKALYRWDMAQYFTPTTITDFIVDLINPQFGEHICDPACGSADFLVASFRYGRKYNPGFADCVWGFDNDPSAVQVAVLNMVLNGDGKSNIKQRDSLKYLADNAEDYNTDLNNYDVLVCNPPFGKKIVESRPEILEKFVLGHNLTIDEHGSLIVGDLLSNQEEGMLFTEICVRQCRVGSGSGRIAIILPNGYLGNVSDKYKLFRQWLLRYTKVAAIVSLPRFTFKQSGADVSASIIYLQKREEPLTSLDHSEDYSFSVQLVERIGWTADKQAKPIYKKDPLNGSTLVDNGSPILDTDLSEVIDRVLNSSASVDFPWLVRGKSDKYSDGSCWSIPISQIVEDSNLSLDPKYLSQKASLLRSNLLEQTHLNLGQLVDLIPEKKNADGSQVVVNSTEIYHYVELADISDGGFVSHELRGWALPDRAKHFADAGDIFFGSIWGSVTKWCVVPRGSENLVVTNGCFRCHIKENKKKYVVDLLAYMTTENWAVQLRSLARGSDGLAEINSADIPKIIIPLLKDADRKKLKPTIDALFEGSASLSSRVDHLAKAGSLGYEIPEPRPSHIVLV